jgi:hypothetical protein
MVSCWLVVVRVCPCVPFFVDFFPHRLHPGICAHKKEKQIWVQGWCIFARIGPRNSKNGVDADVVPNGVGVVAHG